MHTSAFTFQGTNSKSEKTQQTKATIPKRQPVPLLPDMVFMGNQLKVSYFPNSETKFIKDHLQFFCVPHQTAFRILYIFAS